MPFNEVFISSLWFTFNTITHNAVYWVPVILVYTLYHLWYRYIRSYYLKEKNPWVNLEIKLPKIISKSPKAMEVALGIFHQGFEGTWLTRFTEGIVRSWFSLELISVEGKIRFIIRVPKFFKNLVQSHLYSQYPEIEIYEVEDYTREVAYGDPKAKWAFWGVEFGLEKPDAYPIKTYIDYGLDKDPKEEFKVDPMTPVIEYLGSVGANEQVWIQILIMKTKDRFPILGKWFGKQDWRKDSQALVDKLMNRDKSKEEGANFGALMLSPGQREVVEAVERSVSKLGFDCGIRAVYLARDGKFNVYNQVGLMSALKQFGSLHLNGFKPGLKTSFDFPWQDPFGWRLAKRKREMFKAYVRRGYFYPPVQKKPFVLNAEELATIYHFPGEVAKTPSLGHIESKRGEPPTNLPI